MSGDLSLQTLAAEIAAPLASTSTTAASPAPLEPCGPLHPLPTLWAWRARRILLFNKTLVRPGRSLPGVGAKPPGVD